MWVIAPTHTWVFVRCSEMSLKKIKIPVPVESEFLGLGQESVFNLRFNLKENLKVSHVLDLRVSVGFWFGLGGLGYWQAWGGTAQHHSVHTEASNLQDRPIFLLFILFKTHTHKSMAILLPNFCLTPTPQFLCTAFPALCFSSPVFKHWCIPQSSFPRPLLLLSYIFKWPHSFNDHRLMTLQWYALPSFICCDTPNRHPHLDVKKNLRHQSDYLMTTPST